jgi:hypothetical protein
MYQAPTPGVLAATGTAATAGFYTVGMWTLLLAGVALMYTARVLLKRRRARSK